MTRRFILTLAEPWESSTVGDSGVYSSPNSPDIRFVSGHQRSPGAMRARLARTSINSSEDTESRKTSHGSFSETLAGLLNLPSGVSNSIFWCIWQKMNKVRGKIQTLNNVIFQLQDNLTASSITYTRNVVTAEDTFDELLTKMRITSEDSSQ